jgi:hypothetical protein
VKRYRAQGHPRADFLNARARVLAMWRDEGKSPGQSAFDMSMDPTQVCLILMTVDKHPEEYARESPQPGTAGYSDDEGVGYPGRKRRK